MLDNSCCFDHLNVSIALMSLSCLLNARMEYSWYSWLCHNATPFAVLVPTVSKCFRCRPAARCSSTASGSSSQLTIRLCRFWQQNRESGTALSHHVSPLRTWAGTGFCNGICQPQLRFSLPTWKFLLSKLKQWTNWVEVPASFARVSWLFREECQDSWLTL